VTDVVGWLVRLAKGLAPLHALGEPHGRLSANAVHCAGPGARSKAQLIAAEDVARDFSYFSAVRARRRVGPSPADDVWALGVLLYRGLTCACPFPGEGRKGVAERIEWRPASPIEVYGVEHEQLQALLDRVFHSDPVKRLTTVAEWVAALVAIEPEAAALPGLELDRPTAADGGSLPSDEPDIDAVVVAEAVGPASPPAVKPASPAKPTPVPAVDDAAAPAEVPDEPEVAQVVAEPAPAAAPAASHRPTTGAPRRGNSLLKPAVLVPFFALVVVAGYALLRPRWGGSADPAPAKPTAAAVATATAGSASADPSSSGAPSHPSAPPATTSAPPAPPTEASTSSALPSEAVPTEVSAVPPRPENRLQCLRQLFPPATFEAGRPNLYFLCTEADPRKGADALGAEIVLGKGHRDTTPAMREWDKLGWFQMAMFAVVRASCCEAAAPLQSGLSDDACQLDGALIAIGEAVAHGGEDDFAVAVARYLDAIRCLVNSHYAYAFGEKGPPASREHPAFEEAGRRARAARGR